ncbi:MAG: hypothetical protein GXY23_03975 [Myxococcales bacterium]|jgi:ribosome-associated toxin RatA of RatAB toxin-antitoxin module|nr:hypothetical protein [Myxococcales bacterium]
MKKIVAAGIAASLALLPVANPAFARKNDARGEPIETASLPADGFDIRWGRAKTVIPLPRDRVVALLHDYGRYAEIFPYFRASRVLASRGHEALVYLEASLAYDSITLWGNLRISSTQRDGAHVIEATLKRGNVNHFHAIWTVRELPTGQASEVEFKLLVDPNLKLPSSVISSENVRAARKALAALRRKAGEAS